jgi:hypothetical protein
MWYFEMEQRIDRMFALNFNNSNNNNNLTVLSDVSRWVTALLGIS